MFPTDSRGSKAVRLPDNCSIWSLGESLLSILTIAIFTGSPDISQKNDEKNFNMIDNKLTP